MSYIPSERDVRDVRSIVASLGFPTELVLAILDFARYWPEITNESIVHSVLLDEEWSLDFSVASIYLWAELPQSDARYEDENPKMREIEFTIVSHDQGWTTEDTKGSYQTSSWFEASIFRHETPDYPSSYRAYEDNLWTNLEIARSFYAKHRGWHMVPRPSSHMEPQRLHCDEMKNITWSVEARQRQNEIYAEPSRNPQPRNAQASIQKTETYNESDEGKHSWYLQGNEVAKGTSVFQGEMVKRYHVVWGCAANPTWKGDAGAGSGEAFVDSLQKGDIIVVWSRAKRRGWENHVYGVRMTLRYTIN
ncbi:hypothetical protein K505DRAFT_283109 [Melanomma pulvis-pyrius CBS 109.77]|uniref:Uncharacterized protein n=1 Tax=Melanomma pulvis-pyrius CBS 109.77 TaxID=1314802 RepID=A0A6A6X114_9PLEO|nr:hypothetical protein K505DRAFT_283109 [Melanomma pulvis-pyrius CBS 109.77]